MDTKEYNNPKEYVVKEIEKCEENISENKKCTLTYFVGAVVSWVLFWITNRMDIFPDWSAKFTEILSMAGVFMGSYHLYKEQKDQNRLEKLKLRMNLNEIFKNGGSNEDARNYLLEEIKRYKDAKRMDIMLAALLIFLEIIPSFCYAYGVNEMIVPMLFVPLETSILAVDIGCDNHRIDDLETTLDLDEIKRTRNRGNNEK